MSARAGALIGRLHPALLLDRGYGTTALVAALTFFIAFDAGSYGEASRDSLAIAIWWTLILTVAFGVWPSAPPTRAAYVCGGFLLAFALLTLGSIAWATSAEKAFGWPDTEGPTNDPRFLSPTFAYGHGPGPTTGCAIRGGVFYDPPRAQFPSEYVDDYLFADYCSNWIRRLDVATGNVVGLASGLGRPVDPQTTADGSLLYLGAGGRARTAGSCTGSPTRPPDRSSASSATSTATARTSWRSNGVWYVRGGASTQWGQQGDIPVPGDYDADPALDLAVWRPANGIWYVQGSPFLQWGAPEDVPVPEDYDGDGLGKDELAVWRPSNGVWYVRGGASTQWGQQGDIPVPGDYDADPALDLAVWRPANGIWYVQGSPFLQWGAPEDVP